MLCDICKTNEATVHFKGVFNNQSVKMQLCEDCAAKKGLSFAQGQPSFSLADLMSALTELPESVFAKEKSPACARCGLKYETFKSTGRLGCAECYHQFRQGLEHLLKRIHGNTLHVGKRPAAAKTKKQREPVTENLDALRLELANAIKNEQYELAARLRDKIKVLERR